MLECHFWANVMLRQSRLWASRASPAQKLQDLRVVYSKNFSRATFFVFWVTYLVDIYLNKIPVKQIWWKSAVWVCTSTLLGTCCKICTCADLSHHTPWKNGKFLLPWSFKLMITLFLLTLPIITWSILISTFSVHFVLDS